MFYNVNYRCSMYPIGHMSDINNLYGSSDQAF